MPMNLLDNWSIVFCKFFNGVIAAVLQGAQVAFRFCPNKFVVYKQTIKTQTYSLSQLSPVS